MTLRRRSFGREDLHFAFLGMLVGNQRLSLLVIVLYLGSWLVLRVTRRGPEAGWPAAAAS